MMADKKRQRRITAGLFGVGIALPGLAHLFEGRALSGSVRVFLVGTGAALVLAKISLPVPWDVGSLGVALPGVLGGVLLAPLYGISILESVSRMRSRWAVR
jgi:hypothetical protein